MAGLQTGKPALRPTLEAAEPWPGRASARLRSAGGRPYDSQTPEASLQHREQLADARLVGLRSVFAHFEGLVILRGVPLLQSVPLHQRCPHRRTGSAACRASVSATPSVPRRLSAPGRASPPPRAAIHRIATRANPARRSSCRSPNRYPPRCRAGTGWAAGSCLRSTGTPGSCAAPWIPGTRFGTTTM